MSVLKMAKRKGRKPKTLAEKRAEFKEKMMRILRVASVFHNIDRNRNTLHKEKLQLRKFQKELNKAESDGHRKTMSILVRDSQSTVDKMTAWIRDDSKFLHKEMKSFKFNGGKK
jgi:hypothetical protein